MYIELAERKIQELEAEREKTKVLIVAAEERGQELKNALERAEKMEARGTKLGEKIAERAREKINQYKSAMTTLRDEMEFLAGRMSKLEDILEALKNDHNQNYHDMAVKTAVSGWEELKAQEFPEVKISEEELDNLEKEAIDLGDDEIDHTDEFDETVSSCNPLLTFLLTQYIEFKTTFHQG
jgi:protein kinase C substrate 80K-H